MTSKASHVGVEVLRLELDAIEIPDGLSANVEFGM